MTKRDFLKTASLAGMAGLFANQGFAANTTNEIEPVDKFMNEQGEFALPPLPYSYDALASHIDKQTLELHHDKHHAGYVRGLNKAVAKVKEAIDKEDYTMIKHWERELAFHGGGHFFHTIYWNSMSPDKMQPTDLVTKYINKSFGSFKKFESYFFAATKSVEGSGWGVLAYQPPADKMVILQTEKHQNQSQWINIPVLVCDVWEHAYYLKYQNKRGDYIKAFMEIVNWKNVSKRLENHVNKK